MTGPAMGVISSSSDSISSITAALIVVGSSLLQPKTNIIPNIANKTKGSVINIGSIHGIVSGDPRIYTDCARKTAECYGASKAAIIGFTKSVALELGSRNIRCNAIAPGFIETEMTQVLDENTVKEWREQIPLKRRGTPEDIANTSLFLASDMSAYITGQVINVCGGILT